MPTTWYRKVYCIQTPFDMGLDDAQRLRVGFNILADKVSSDTFTEEIVALLVAAGVGTEGVNIFVGSKVSIPNGAGPYLHIVETAGREPDDTHNSLTVPAYERPGAQIVVRALTRPPARTMANAAYRALNPIINTSVTF